MAAENELPDQADEDAALAAPPDAQNPAIIDAHKIFVATMISAALFIGSVILFVL